MATVFGRDELLSAFDVIGEAAATAGTKLEIAVYGESALMLASNFRFASEDVDVSWLGRPWPGWLDDAVQRIADERGWADDWLNDAVEFHLSPLATSAADHLLFGTFPRDGGAPGLLIYVPVPEYLLALKLKAMRVADPLKGKDEARDIVNLMAVVGVTTSDEALEVLARYFPRSAASPEKQRFLLKHLLSTLESDDAAAYPLGHLLSDQSG